jgi:hypothetical protein
MLAKTLLKLAPAPPAADLFKKITHKTKLTKQQFPLFQIQTHRYTTFEPFQIT